jgi:protocatechuate 3,4-dioxygenase beta subunit
MAAPGLIDSDCFKGDLKLTSLVSAIALALCVSIAGFAQFESASVVGTVKDPTGLPMPQVTVEIRSIATNITRATTTAATGDYDFVALQPGQYALWSKYWNG